ncbi:unnamed protein product, partial [Rotaria sp. Silwood2]
MGEKVATPEVIAALIDVVRCEDWSWGWRASGVLADIARKAGSREVINALINALLDR